jgi:hypothetical protein
MPELPDSGKWEIYDPGRINDPPFVLIQVDFLRNTGTMQAGQPLKVQVPPGKQTTGSCQHRMKTTREWI